HLLAMSPSIAELFARHGIGKDEIRRHLYENTVTGAGFLEYVGRQATPFRVLAAACVPRYWEGARCAPSIL
ncbi:MAG: hypothetical protein R3247_10615, partial [Rhodothermales bacterium]|nr:hypothetical protein [Rhodothermales bacterium]